MLANTRAPFSIEGALLVFRKRCIVHKAKPPFPYLRRQWRLIVVDKRKGVCGAASFLNNDLKHRIIVC